MRRAIVSLGLAFAAVLSLAGSAGAAEFGLSEFDATFTDSGGEAVTQAGAHPFAFTTRLRVNTETTAEGTFPVESTKDLLVALAPGFVGDQNATELCSTLDFLDLRPGLLPGGQKTPNCADGTAVGLAHLELGTGTGTGVFPAPIYNLEPAPGKVARLGFVVETVPVVIDIGLNEKPPYNLVAISSNISQALEVLAAELEIWGVPTDPAHDDVRGRCFEGGGPCPPGTTEKRPFLTLPRSCGGPVETRYRMDSWQHPGIFVEGGSLSHDSVPPFEPVGMSGCDQLGFDPQTDAQPTSPQAGSAAGLDFTIDVNDPGLKSSTENADADISAVRTALPVGVTLNPATAAGLDACTKSQYDAASLGAPGCPEATKIGSLEVETPLLRNHALHGSVYVAQPDDPATNEPGAENPFDSLLALYLVVRDPALGVFVKLPAKVAADERTGQIVTTVEGLPQFPLSHVDIHLHGGSRAPLVMPSSCGTYTTHVSLTPSSGAAPVDSTSSFTVDAGLGGGPCPNGPPPFDPGFTAGSLDNTAGTYSPFLMRMTRNDGQQEITRFSASLPAGVVPKIAGLAKCGDAEIASARAKSGREELAAPSCPPGSEIGNVTAGAGVGSDLTYVHGKAYLAGPYHGDPLSAVAIVPAVAGPFDVGTVVTHVGLRLNPVTYVGEIDDSASDRIPRILEGIPLQLRDVRIDTDRPEFTRTPTSCAVEATEATIFSTPFEPFDTIAETSVSRSSRYQAASCAALGFRPKLSLRFTGGTKRADHPALHSVITYPKGSGYANVRRAVVTLPPSEFIDQAHISSPCTRPRFAAGTCPPGSILGSAKAWTPLLDEPLSGLVYFRSNGGERALPDIVVDLNGAVHVTLLGQVHSVVHKGVSRLRTTFASAPDAPISKFRLDLKGGKKGLLESNRNLCRHPLRYEANFVAHNERRYNSRPMLRVAGCKKHKRQHHR
jgi:hypothetical protein